MSEQRGEISEVDALTTDQPVGDGATTPAAADANQVADGEPKNYSDGEMRDQDLARRTELDGLRVEREPHDNVVRDRGAVRDDVVGDDVRDADVRDRGVVRDDVVADDVRDAGVADRGTIRDVIDRTAGDVRGDRFDETAADPVRGEGEIL